MSDIVSVYFQRHLRQVTKCDREQVCHGDLHFVPGRNIFAEMERCVAESAVFVAVISKKYCNSYFWELEISEAQKTGKPIILILIEHVDENAMGIVIRDVFMKIVKEEGVYKLYPEWEQLCQAVIDNIKIIEDLT